MNKKVISARELALIGLLIVLAAYYFVVQGPVKKQTDEYEMQLAQLQSQVEVAQMRVAEKQRMQDEIDAIMEKYNGNPPLTPEYNNINYIIGELNAIFASTPDYSISFGQEAADESNPNIVRRPISVSFTTDSYKEAISRIKKINASENQYLIQNCSIVRQYSYTNWWGGRVQNSGYSVGLSLLSFEYNVDGITLVGQE